MNEPRGGSNGERPGGTVGALFFARETYILCSNFLEQNPLTKSVFGYIIYLNTVIKGINMEKQRVDIRDSTDGFQVIANGEITEYYSWEHACYAGWALSWFLKAELYVDDWWEDAQDFYGDGDPEFPQICEHL